MKAFKADLHIHSVLSPCADLEMSPINIVKRAKEQGLDFIGITDHNSTKQAKTTRDIGSKYGLPVFMGVEITTREEVHCLCFFDNDNALDEFQQYIEEHQPRFSYNPETLGYQVCVDENEQITEQIEYYLGVALEKGIDEICDKVHSLNGLFIPAHINRSRYSLISQLGFVPPDIKANALELFNRSSKDELLHKYSYLSRFSLMKNSDSHYLKQVGAYYSSYNMNECTFEEFRMAIARINGRSVEIL